MPDPVRQTVELGPQWPTIDPFLFCAHHDDAYPSGEENLGPDPALLDGRDIGMDFEGRDGWRMYHGQRVPGFPPHPHRGFETVTYVRKGIIDHADSLGAAARFGRGDVQWLTAGKGIQHSEMFPLLDADRPQPARAVPDLAEPPVRRQDGRRPLHHVLGRRDPPAEGRGGVEVTVIAGRLAGADEPPAPPPASCASHAEADLAIWHIVLEPGATWTLPPGRGPRDRPHPLRLRRHVAPHRRPRRRPGHGHRRGRRRPGRPRPLVGRRGSRCSCCRAGPWASRWPATARSS